MDKYTLIRSKRKTVALYIRDGYLEVRAPQRMRLRTIEGYIATHEDWIRGNLAESRIMLDMRENFSLNYGDTITLRGAEYMITARNGKEAGFDGRTVYLPPGLSSEQIKSVCKQVYRRLAKACFVSKVERFGRLMGVVPLAVKVSSAKARWGSCTRKGNINFTWRLMMAEDEVIDYVVVHELAHLTELNHSERFWTIVEQVLPDYHIRRNKLRDLQNKLNRENWD
ncbi:MAG: M48 family metallopeptidase [Peptococcaceae bacterium]|nr:M48 family metallopeptidase [Peptococcaceae bacterium]